MMIETQDPKIIMFLICVWIKKIQFL